MTPLSLALLPMLMLAGSATAQPAPPSPAASPAATISAGRLQDVRLLVPDGTARALVVHVSDRAGWTGEDDVIAGALRQQGDIVLGVDLSSYAKALDAAEGACLYVVGEITDLAQAAQRRLGLQTYLPPIVTGRDEGATFAYAALADAPANTLGGAVAWGFANRLSLRLPFCPGATATRTGDGQGYSYAFDKALPEAASVFVDSAALAAVRSQAAGQQAIAVAALDPADPAGQVVGAVAALAPGADPFGRLPAIDLPADPPPARAVALLISGDGGWRDLDKTIGEWMATQGVHVVGLDALRYFWSKRRPQELAADIAALLAQADPSGRLPVLLIGYSFGADTLPFAWPLLPRAVQDRTRTIALLGPGQSTSFQITVSGWLGIGDSGNDVPPAIAALPAGRVICVHGRDEKDSACTNAALTGVTGLETAGGHHFDGDYEGLARKLLDLSGLP